MASLVEHMSQVLPWAVSEDKAGELKFAVQLSELLLTGKLPGEEGRVSVVVEVCAQCGDGGVPSVVVEVCAQCDCKVSSLHHSVKVLLHVCKH